MQSQLFTGIWLFLVLSYLLNTYHQKFDHCLQFFSEVTARVKATRVIPLH